MLQSTIHAIKTFATTSIFHHLLGFEIIQNLAQRTPKHCSTSFQTHYPNILQNATISHIVICVLFEQKSTILNYPIDEQIEALVNYPIPYEIDIITSILQKIKKQKGLTKHIQIIITSKQSKIIVQYSQQLINNYFQCAIDFCLHLFMNCPYQATRQFFYLQCIYSPMK